MRRVELIIGKRKMQRIIQLEISQLDSQKFFQSIQSNRSISTLILAGHIRFGCPGNLVSR